MAAPDSELLALFEADAATAAPSDQEVSSIAKLAERQLKLQREVVQIEAELKAKQNDLRDVQTRLLPEAMTAAGVTSIKLTDGSVVEIEPKTYTGITEPNESEAFAWLEANEHGSIIKQTVSVDFARAKNAKEDAARAEKLAKLQEILAANGLTFAVKKGVHHSTLKAFVNEQLKKGSDIPHQTFGIYQEQVAKVTPRK